MLTANIDFIKIKQLKDELVLLNNINFTIDKNKVYTILGKNGAGKSTLVNSITRLLNANDYTIKCRIEFDGRDLYSITEEELRSIRKDKIKYVFQDAHKSFDQLKTFEYYFSTRAKSILEVDELLSFFLLPPSGKLFSLYPYEISGGMAQRISFILALLADPNLLILDEPAASVDSAIANLFLIKIKDFVKEGNKSALIISQDLMFTQKISDKIAFLSNGTLSKFSKPEEFYENNQSKEVQEFLNFYKMLK